MCPGFLKIKELDVLLYQIGISLPLEYEARQSILDAESYLELFAYEEKLISHETDIARIKKEFRSRSGTGSTKIRRKPSCGNR